MNIVLNLNCFTFCYEDHNHAVMQAFYASSKRPTDEEIKKFLE